MAGGGAEGVDGGGAVPLVGGGEDGAGAVDITENDYRNKNVRLKKKEKTLRKRRIRFYVCFSL